jgi:hypothetical protein
MSKFDIVEVKKAVIRSGKSVMGLFPLLYINNLPCLLDIDGRMVSRNPSKAYHMVFVDLETIHLMEGDPALPSGSALYLLPSIIMTDEVLRNVSSALINWFPDIHIDQLVITPVDDQDCKIIAIPSKIELSADRIDL